MTASIDKTEIKAGETATVAGKHGDKVTPIEGAKFVYESGNEAVATVAEDGTVTAVKAGSADITVQYTKDNKAIARTVLHVTVK
ncbi:MAG: Ig-like domain-containing protein [Eubacteriales bacterium]|nr:Ig-like domain-containing protein [Eubacteriales bacterium]